jgi:Ca2+-binding EF-hand superfamily protein
MLTDNNKKPITEETFKQWSIRFQENLSDQEIKDLFENSDINNDGVIGESDLIYILNRTNLY